jgi:glycosyltransferase involved in cell wall biosynthesis
MLFSVIVANYNNENYLPQLINSILSQSYSDWELIIIDDASKISPKKLLSPFLSDERVKYFEHEKNGGVAVTFKTAIDRSSGEIVGMLGADDALMPDALFKMVEAHKKYPSASMINSDCYWCDENLNVIEKYKHYKALLPGEELIRNLTVGSFATFKKSAYDLTQGFDPFFQKAVDHDLYLKLDEVGTLAYVHEPLYLYRQNENGISQGSKGTKALNFSLKARLNAYHRRLGTNKENLLPKEAKVILKKWYLNELYDYRISGMRIQFILLHLQLLRDIPSIIINKTFWANTFRIFFKMP